MRALFSPPNLLTCVRIGLTPVIVLTPDREQLHSGVLVEPASPALRMLPTVTSHDRWGTSRAIGAYLDPIADKVLLTALYLCFGVAGLAPWWLVWLVVGRDIMILSLAAGGLFWKGIRDFPPTIWGKFSTLLQIAACSGHHRRVRIRGRSRCRSGPDLRDRRRNCMEWFSLPPSRAAGYVFRIPLRVKARFFRCTECLTQRTDGVSLKMSGAVP